MHNAPAKANEHNNVEGNVNSNLAAIVAENFWKVRPKVPTLRYRV